MYVSEVLEPSRLDNAYNEEVSLGGLLAALATGSCRICLIILGNLLVGFGCYMLWKFSKKTYRAFTNHEPHTMGGFIALSGFGILSMAEYIVLKLVNHEAEQLSKANNWADSTKKFFIRTCDGIFPLFVFYMSITKLYNWSVTKKSLTKPEQSSITLSYLMGICSLILADVEFYFAQQSKQYAESAISRAVAHAGVVILICLGLRFFVQWFLAIRRTYDQQFAFAFYNDIKH